MENKEISDEKLSQLIIENIPRPAWVKDHELTYIGRNTELSNLVGKQMAKRMLGRKDHELIWECYSTTYQAADREVLNNETAIEYLNLVKPDNHEHVVMVTQKSRLRNFSGKYTGVLGIISSLWPSTEHAFRLLMDLDNSLIAQSGYKTDQYIFYENSLPNAGNLTKKELICLFYLLRGASNKDISRLLNLSLRTVETHLEHIKYKLNCYSKSELISKAIEQNMLRFIPKNIKIQDLLIVKQIL